MLHAKHAANTALFAQSFRVLAWPAVQRTAVDLQRMGQAASVNDCKAPECQRQQMEMLRGLYEAYNATLRQMGEAARDALGGSASSATLGLARKEAARLLREIGAAEAAVYRLSALAKAVDPSELCAARPPLAATSPTTPCLAA